MPTPLRAATRRGKVPGRDPADPRPVLRAVTLYSAWRGMLFAHVTPLVLVLIGALAIGDAGVNAISLGLVAAGVALEGASLFDYPIRSTFGLDGIERRCPLRRQMLPWSRISDLRRAPGPRFRRRAPGGLVAACGRRRYLLVDRAEGADEFDALVSGIAAWAPAVAVHAVRPPADSPPTWLYRRGGRAQS